MSALAIVDNPPRPRIYALLDDAAKAFGVTRAMLTGPCRTKISARARFAVMRVAGSEWGWSQSQIGRVLNRDHTTVLSGLRRAHDLTRLDPDFAASMAWIARRSA